MCFVATIASNKNDTVSTRPALRGATVENAHCGVGRNLQPLGAHAGRGRLSIEKKRECKPTAAIACVFNCATDVDHNFVSYRRRWDQGKSDNGLLPKS
jgi:hypothetical protein